MKHPCSECIVRATCRRDQSECQKLWDYNVSVFKTQMMLTNLIEDNKKLRAAKERSPK